MSSSPFFGDRGLPMQALLQPEAVGPSGEPTPGRRLRKPRGDVSPLGARDGMLSPGAPAAVPSFYDPPGRAYASRALGEASPFRPRTLAPLGDGSSSSSSVVIGQTMGPSSSSLAPAPASPGGPLLIDAGSVQTIVAQITRIMDSRLSLETSARESLTSEVRQLRDQVGNLQGTVEQQASVLAAARAREAALERRLLELGAARGAGDEERARSAAAAASFEGLASAMNAQVRRLSDELAAAHARIDAVQRAGAQQHRDLLSAFEAEAATRASNEEALGSRLNAMQRSVTEAASAASHASTAAAAAQTAAVTATAALASGRGSVIDDGDDGGSVLGSAMGSVYGGRGGRSSSPGPGSSAASVAQTAALRSALDGAVHDMDRRIGDVSDTVRRQVSRVESEVASKLGRLGMDVDEVRHGVMAEVSRRVETVLSASTASIADLASKLQEQAMAVTALTGQMSELRGSVAASISAVEEGTSRRATGLEAALGRHVAASERREQALGDALLRGLQQESSARETALASITLELQARAQEFVRFKTVTGSSVSALRSDLDEAREALRRDALDTKGMLDKRLADLDVTVDKRLTAREAAADDRAAKQEAAFTAMLDGMRAEATELRHASEKRFAAAERASREGIEEVQHRFADLSGELRRELERDRIAAEKRFAGVDRAHNDTLRALQGGLAEATAEFKREATRAADNMERRVAALETGQLELSRTAQAAVDDVQALFKRDIETARGALERRVAEAEAAVEVLRGELAAKSQEMDKSQVSFSNSLTRDVETWQSTLEARVTALVRDSTTATGADITGKLADAMARHSRETAEAIERAVIDTGIKAEEACNALRARMGPVLQRMVDESRRLVLEEAEASMLSRLHELREAVLDSLNVERSQRTELTTALDRKLTSVEQYCQDWVSRFERDVEGWQTSLHTTLDSRFAEQTDAVNKLVGEVTDQAQLQKALVSEISLAVKTVEDRSRNELTETAGRLMERLRIENGDALAKAGAEWAERTETALAALKPKLTDSFTKSVEERLGKHTLALEEAVAAKLQEAVSQWASTLAEESSARRELSLTLTGKQQTLDKYVKDWATKFQSEVERWQDTLRTEVTGDIDKISTSVAADLEAIRRDYRAAQDKLLKANVDVSRLGEDLETALRTRLSEEIRVATETTARAVTKAQADTAEALNRTKGDVSTALAELETLLASRVRDADAAVKSVADRQAVFARAVEDQLARIAADRGSAASASSAMVSDMARSYDSKIAELVTAVTQVDRAVAEAKLGLTTIAPRVDALESSERRLDDALARATAATEGAGRELRRLDETVARTAGIVEAVAREFPGVQASVKALKTGLDTVTATADRDRAALADVATGLDTRVGRLERTLDRHTELLADTVSAADLGDREQRLKEWAAATFTARTANAASATPAVAGVDAAALERELKKRDAAMVAALQEEAKRRETAIAEAEGRLAGAVADVRRAVESEAATRNSEMDDLADELKEAITRSEGAVTNRIVTMVAKQLDVASAAIGDLSDYSEISRTVNFLVDTVADTQAAAAAGH